MSKPPKTSSYPEEKIDQPQRLWQDSLDPECLAKLRNLLICVQTADIAQRVGKLLLTDKERSKIGDLATAFAKLRTIGIWRQVRGGSQPRAIIDISERLGLTDETTANWLRRCIGVSPTSSTSKNRPHWDGTTGEITWRGKLAGKFRIMSAKSKQQQILDAFEAAGWPDAMPNPIRNADHDATYHAVSYLNARLKGISFGTSQGAKQINWSSGSKS